jgi:hypothetical protein
MTDLSFGYTVRGYSGNIKSDTRLASDRSRVTDDAGTGDASATDEARKGNHRDGWNAYCSGGNVIWVKSGTDDGEKLVSSWGLPIYDDKAASSSDSSSTGGGG